MKAIGHWVSLVGMLVSFIALYGKVAAISRQL